MDVPSVQEVQCLLQRQIDEENEIDRQINIHEQRDHELRRIEVTNYRS